MNEFLQDEELAVRCVKLSYCGRLIKEHNKTSFSDYLFDKILNEK